MPGMELAIRSCEELQSLSDEPWPCRRGVRSSMALPPGDDALPMVDLLVPFSGVLLRKENNRAWPSVQSASCTRGYTS